MLEEQKIFYKNYEIFAEVWLHEYLADYLIDNFTKDKNILILWSWSGALDARLIDLWYKNISSVDIDSDSYLYCRDKVTFLSLDLNKEFSKKIRWEFDLILAVEVIEHLNNPSNILQEAKKLLSNNWVLLITTPNVHSDKSRLNNLLFWYPKSFYWTPNWDAHISIMTFGILEHFAHLNNMYLDNYFSILDNNKDYWFTTKLYLKMKKIIFQNSSVFSILINSKINKIREWDIAIYLFKHSHD
jgi:SAM-dependent methyltransferase